MVYETRKNKQIALTSYNCNKFTEKVVITRHIHIKTNIERDAPLLPLSTVHTANRKKMHRSFLRFQILRLKLKVSIVQALRIHCSSTLFSVLARYGIGLTEDSHNACDS